MRSDKDSREHATDRFWELARLYVVADKFHIPKLKNNIIDRLFESLHYGAKRYAYPPPLPVIDFIYSNTSGNNAFRKLMIAWLTFGANEEIYTSEDTQTLLLENRELAADLALRFGQSRYVKDEPGSLFNSERALLYENTDLLVGMAEAKALIPRLQNGEDSGKRQLEDQSSNDLSKREQL